MAKRRKKKNKNKNKNKKRRTPARSSARSQSQARSSSSSGVGWFERQMVQVGMFYQAEAYEEALELLLKVKRKYPRHPRVLSALADVNIAMKNWQAVAIYSEQLYPMERGDGRATTLNNLMNAYMKLMLPSLAWKTACMLVADHPDFHLIERAENMAQELKPALFETFGQLDLLSERFGADQDAMLAFMVEHDQMRFLAESNQNQEAILHCQRLLAKVPGFIPALNNMSLAYFNEGNLEKAIEVTQEVLVQEADNYHALANLTRYSFLMGQTDVAWSYATELKGVEDDSSQRWLKQAEALSYLGDDEGVIDAYFEAEPDDLLTSPLFLHLAAAAHYRLEEESKAWQLWQQALRINPSFDMAITSLAERRKEAHERDVGWYWPLNYWLAGDFRRSFLKLSQSEGEREGAVKKAIQKTLKQYPQLPVLLPHILDRGDPLAKKTMLLLIEAMKTADLAQALVPFGSSRFGTDAQRMKALQILAEHHPDLLPPDRKVSVWINGKQQEIMLLGFQIYSEPEETILDDETYEVFRDAHHYLSKKRDLKRAERLFKKVIKAFPHFPSAYNQLSLVYELQGRYQEARKLVKETHRRFPDYAFASIALARYALQEKRVEEAREYLNPVLDQKELHVSELRALAQAEIEYALATEHKEGARIWLNMWEQVEEDHPDIPNWKARIEGKNSSEERRNLVRKLLGELGL
ncbi:MAG: tetratricopeptide repeat protein [Ardenticatenaceae bacterium]